MAPQEPERVGVRDLDRIREKVTLRLEPRHAILAGIGGVALLVAAFAVGLLVGRSCEQTTAEAPSGAIEAPAPLVEPAPPRDPAAPARRHAIRPVSAPPPVARGPAGLPPAGTPRRGPDEVPAPPPPRLVADEGPWPALAITDPCAGLSCASPDGSGCVFPGPSPLGVEAALALDRPWVRPSGVANWSSRRIRDCWFAARQTLEVTASFFSRWVSLALRTPPAAPVASTPPPGSPPPALATATSPSAPAHATALASGWFTVQVRSYRDEALAREFAASLRSEGYSVEVARHDAGGQAWFRVRVGRFPTLGEARDFARRLNDRTGDQAIVTAMEAR